MRAVSSRRRRVVVGNTKGITVSESLDVSLARRCFYEWETGNWEGWRKGRRPKRNGVATNSSKSLSLSPVSPGSCIRLRFARPRPYVCSLSRARQTLSSRDGIGIGNKRKLSAVISAGGGESMNLADSCAVPRADFVP